MFKKYFALMSLTLAVAGSSMAHADDELTFCGLPESSSDDRMVDLPGSIDLGRATKTDVEELDSLTRQQLVIAARTLGINAHGTWQAVLEFRDASEAGDLYVGHFRVGRDRFTRISYYPGGNPGGVIFKKGTRTAIATIDDSTLSCL